MNTRRKLIYGSFRPADIESKNIKEALTFWPALIVNGKAVSMKGNGGSGQNPRTVIAQRKDGVILFLVVNGYGSRLSYRGRGITIITGIIVYLLRKIVALNIPVIGEFIADVIDIVEQSR